MSLTTIGSSGAYLNGYTEITHKTVHERDVSYRFYLHQHPYVQRLVQQLIRLSTTGLQRADTDYSAGASLPESVEVTLPSDRNVTVPADVRIALQQDVRAASDAGTITLVANLAPTLFADAPARVPSGTRATLVDGRMDTPTLPGPLQLTEASDAVLFHDTRIMLTAATRVILYNGTEATIPANTPVLLTAGAPVTLPIGQVTFQRCKPLPTYFKVLFDNVNYQPTVAVRHPYPVADLDFTSSGAYSVYNWELFFHVPFTIAIHLSKNQRFAEAQRWFHYLFDPTDNSDGPPERFWKVRPFQETEVRKIEEILVNLATNTDEKLREDTLICMQKWADAPFRPHVIARFRQQAYMYKTVMAYLDNLIAWGDSLFRQDTGEAIDEAMMVYVLAANILGPRPQLVPRPRNMRPQTYENLRSDIHEFGVVIRGFEASLAFDPALPPGAGRADDSAATLRSLSQSLYFCVPRNDKLNTYWDTVADRLFKIRNSLNLQGVFRQLALFEPPIDPAMLARAAAAGLDVGAIVNGLNQPLPLVRFQMLVQKAAEICQEVKSLGSNLLSAMEREDGEAMAILRAKHERVVMDMVEQVKYAQLQEATKSKEGLLQTLALAVQRYTFYEMQLGKKADEIEKTIPGWDDLDKDSLEKMKFKMEEAGMALREIEVDIATDVAAQAAQFLNGGKLLSSHEVRESLFLEGAQFSSDIANILSVLSAVGFAIPTFQINTQPMGAGATTEYGGKNFGDALAATAAGARALADRLNFEARRAARIDSFARREREWAFQSNLARGEISQIFKQLRAAEIREAIAELELRNHRKQMEHAAEIEHFLNEEGTERTGKKTNKSLYTWMKREVKGLYAQSFQLAFDIAKKAERALQHELGNLDLSYVQFGYLAGKEGLLAGEKLYLDVRRMELAFHGLNQREYELTKHVSLLQVNPLALIQLRTTGHCTVQLPESIFDMDGPGHYFRRIKTVALTIPCVAGPYAGVNCRLTLLKSSIRKTQVVGEGYARADAEDPRFSDNFGSLQSIVTSSAQNDSGLFETNLRDERYLPFENSGVISEWQLDLPADPSKGDPAQFDYNTISDVILHIRYTAREGGGLLRTAATSRVKDLIKAAQATGTVRLFSSRHEFPTQWADFKNQTPGASEKYELTLDLRAEHYPFWSANRLKQITAFDVLVRNMSEHPPADVDVLNQNVKLGRDSSYGDLLFGRTTDALPIRPEGQLKLFFSVNEMNDIWIAVSWSDA